MPPAGDDCGIPAPATEDDDAADDDNDDDDGGGGGRMVTAALTAGRVRADATNGARWSSLVT